MVAARIAEAGTAIIKLLCRAPLGAALARCALTGLASAPSRSELELGSFEAVVGGWEMSGRNSRNPMFLRFVDYSGPAKTIGFYQHEFCRCGIIYGKPQRKIGGRVHAPKNHHGNK